MAKRNKRGPVRGPRTQGVQGSLIDQSVIVRSAESLGRVIGALQRQLDAFAGQTKSVNGRKVNGVKTGAPKKRARGASKKTVKAKRRG